MAYLWLKRKKKNPKTVLKMETGELARPVERLSEREDLSKPQTLYKKPGMIHVIAIQC